MDGRQNNGGAREGAGRKPKADELKLIEKLSPLDDIAFDKLQQGLFSGDIQFLKLFMEYRYGKPKQAIDANIEGLLEVVWNEQRTYETK